MTTLAPTPAGLASIDAVTANLASVGYISTRSISTAVYLAHHLRKPVLIEGPAGVGKTDLAVSLSRSLEFPLLRMQCYEGLDEGKALYEWKYGKQLLYTQILKEKIHHLIDGADSLEASFRKLAGFQDLFFSRDFLEPRPLLRSMVAFVQSVRDENIRKLPSISETVDWARTLMLLHADSLEESLVRDTLNVILKRESDIIELRGRVEALTQAALTQAGGPA